MLILVLKRKHKQYVCISVVSWNVNELEVIITLFCLEKLMLDLDVPKPTERQTIYFPLKKKMQLLNVKWRNDCNKGIQCRHLFPYSSPWEVDYLRELKRRERRKK